MYHHHSVLTLPAVSSASCVLQCSEVRGPAGQCCVPSPVCLPRDTVNCRLGDNAVDNKYRDNKVETPVICMIDGGQQCRPRPSLQCCMHDPRSLQCLTLDIYKLPHHTSPPPTLHSVSALLDVYNLLHSYNGISREHNSYYCYPLHLSAHSQQSERLVFCWTLMEVVLLTFSGVLNNQLEKLEAAKAA